MTGSGRAVREVRDALLRAATIRERLPVASAGPPSPEAAARLTRWRTRPPFADDGQWQARLAADGLLETDLVTLLGQPGVATGRRRPAWAWMRLLEQTMLAEADFPEVSDCRESGISRTEAADSPGLGHSFEGMGLARLCAPLTTEAEARLRAGLDALAAGTGAGVFDPGQLTGQLSKSLPGVLEPMLLRTAVLELHRARLAGELAGGTPQQRFSSFAESLGRAGRRRSLLTAYPVLGRQLAVAAECWMSASLRLARDLVADRELIAAVFAGGGQLGPVSQIVTGLGDPHRGGATAAKVTWADGLSLMYKPRPSVVDAHFQQLLGWVNDHGVTQRLRVVKCVGRLDHGWMEFVTAGPCADEPARRRFYYRQGELLALLYLLNASDMHAENLIAAGEQPVVVDLESLVQPGLSTDSPSSAAQQAAHAAIRGSVLMTGLLPRPDWAGEAGGYVDASGLGSLAGQRAPLAVPTLIDPGKDTARIKLDRPLMSGSANQPAGPDAALRLLDYAGEIAAGFTEVYRLCAANREELLAGPLGAFDGDEVRVVARHTLWYDTVLQTAFHPDVLRDGLDRERHFDALWRDVPRRPQLAALTRHERSDLWRNDIPVFTARTDKAVLYGSDHRVVPGFRLSPGMTELRRRLGQLGQLDLARQRWLIEAALTTTAGNMMDDPTLPSYPRPPASAPAQRDAIVAAAEAVGGRLAQLAFQDGDTAQWLGVNSYGGENRTLGVLRSDLFHGLTGIALFLGWLGELTGDTGHTRLARRATGTALMRLDQGELAGRGGFAGLGGAVYALFELGRLWGDERLIGTAGQYAAKIAARPADDTDYDYATGSAGGIAALAALCQVRATDQLADHVRVLADHLVTAAVRTPAGAGWVPRTLRELRSQTRPISGFAHGGAGIAAALSQAWQLIGDDRYRQAACEAIACEQSSFDPGTGRWRELRDGDARGIAERYPDRGFWCYGGAGIGLGRLLARPSLIATVPASARLAGTEIDSALTMVATQPPGSHCLCHGDLGNLELFLAAAEVMRDQRWRHAAGLRAAEILASIERHGWQCGTPLGVQVPGLMTGLAGIGLGLLRVAEPDRVPAVLMLRPSGGPLK
jgi:type 2 lantibiotic biosynthesis protein LanM